MGLQPFIEPGVWGETVQITEIRPFTWQRSETWEGWSAQTGTQSLLPHLQPLFIHPRLNRKPRDYIKQTLRLPCSYYPISACFPLVIPSILFGISFHKTWKMKLYMCVWACMCVWWILKQTVVSKSDCTYLFLIPHLFLKTAEWYWHSLSRGGVYVASPWTWEGLLIVPTDRMWSGWHRMTFKARPRKVM